MYKSAFENLVTTRDITLSRMCI